MPRSTGLRATHVRALTALATVAAIAAAGLVSAGPASADSETGPAAATADASLTSAPVDPGTRLTEFPLPNPSSLPNDVVAGSDGSIWVSTFADKQVLRMSRDGAITTTAQLTGGPSSLATDGEGGAWAAEYASNAIAHISAAGAVTEYPIPTASSFPAHVYDSGDLVFFTESNTGKLGRLTQSTGAIVEYPIAGAGSLWALDGIAADQIWITDPQTETLWIANGSGGIVDYYAHQGAFREISLSSPTPGEVRAFLASDTEIRFLQRSPTGFGGSGVLDGVGSIEGMTVLDDKVWFVDARSNSIGWVLSREAHSYRMPTSSSGMSGMAVTDGRYVWSAEKSTGKVARFDSYGAIAVERVGGADRYEVAASAVMTYGSSGGRVFIASGEKFPDALSAGAVAAQNGGALLLTSAQSLPGSTRDALIAKMYSEIVVVGGPSSVSDDVLSQIRTALPLATTTRIGGADRYEVSQRLLASKFLPSGAKTLYIANGRDFPDALSSTPAAAAGKGAVLLVDGLSSELPAAATALIRDVGARGGTVRIAGGPNSISSGIESQIASLTQVERFGGADRYEVALAINKSAFPSAAGAAFASGSVFPDALSGGALVGSFAKPFPMYLVRPTCVTSEVLDQIETARVQTVLIFGGPNTLSEDVKNLQACP